MKFTIEVECTPEEARRFLGLPDVTPLHEAMLEQMRARLADAAAATAPEAMLRAWMPFAPAMPEALLRAMRGGPWPDPSPTAAAGGTQEPSRP